MLRITVKRLLFTGSEWRGINVSKWRDDENQEQGRPRSGHWKKPVCAEQGEALVTFAAFSVRGNFFLPRNFSSALSCKVEFIWNVC